MKDRPPSSAPGVGLRVYGVLAIAFGVFQLSLLVVHFPPHARLVPGILLGILFGLLGIGVFLLMRWVSLVFAIFCLSFGAFMLYCLRYAQPGDGSPMAIVIIPFTFAPAYLVRRCWSSLR